MTPGFSAYLVVSLILYNCFGLLSSARAQATQRYENTPHSTGVGGGRLRKSLLWGGPHRESPFRASPRAHSPRERVRIARVVESHNSLYSMADMRR